MQTLAAHYSAIDGARKILGIDSANSAIEKPIGALALSCTVVRRSFILCFNHSSHDNH
jgi:hypothetical protein